jgi:undecaprenyl-diphosphatase
LEQLIETIILGIVQGLTEWLPISSTGHLKLFENLLNMKVPILFDVILHAGTLIVVLVFFRKEISKILLALAHLDFKTEHGRMVPLIIVGVVPTALIGLVFGWLIEDAFTTALRIGIAFLFCGVMLYSAKFGKEKTDSINYSTAIMIGIAQGIAIIPGISRSGATIAVALLLGIKREEAFKFSFLISIPAILGALGYTVYAGFSKLTSTGLDYAEILAGAIVAMVVGYFALKLLWKIISKGKFHLFAFYCWILGAVLVLLSVF